MKSPAELTDLFRQRGLKVTPQRQRIFELLASNKDHPTAESMYALVGANMPTVSRKTVYQTLNDLAAMGEIQQFELGTGARRFDPNVDSHHHLVCSECGKVQDVWNDDHLLSITEAQRKGFTVWRAEVIFRGLCDECSQKERAS
jgi:Fe2+ or Zn2+ uptake regulation protein